MTDEEETTFLKLLEKVQDSDEYLLTIKHWANSNVYSIYIVKRDDDEWAYLTGNHGETGMKMYQGAEESDD